MAREVVRRYLPNAVLAVAAPEDTGAREAIALLEGREAIDGRPTAYVCEHFICKLPVTEPEDLPPSSDRIPTVRVGSNGPLMRAGPS